MLIDGHRYPVLMSQTLYRWLMFDKVRPILDAGPGSWPLEVASRSAGSRPCTRTRSRSGIIQGGRVLRLTQKDARTLIGIPGAPAIRPWPPEVGAVADLRLRWQVGDLDAVPGLVHEQVRAMRLVQVAMASTSHNTWTYHWSLEIPDDGAQALNLMASRPGRART